METDQTKDMDKEILQHQRENIPLRRFAQVSIFCRGCICPTMLNTLFILLAQGDRWSDLASPLASRELHDRRGLPRRWVRCTCPLRCQLMS